jgi:monofunctional glycosyltransferase
MVSSQQFPDFEPILVFEKGTAKYRRHRFLYFIAYIIFILYFSIPSFQIPLLEYNGFRFTSLMDQRAVESGLAFYPSQSWTNLESVNPNLLRSIICMEDGDFFRHKGIDWDELNIALKLNKRRGRTIRGGSTLTMQLSKNLFLNTERSVFRKGKEFIISFRMEKEISKKAILENYVNAVEWGDGLFGIKRASEFYFEKEPADLTTNECARLAAVIPSPLEHKPTDDSRYVLRRSNIIKSRMGSVNLSPVL